MVQTGACRNWVVYTACGSRDWAGTSPTSPPRQPQSCPCSSRARTGAPHGVSGGASQGPAARQTRLHNTQRSPGSGRTALDVICEHNADAGEGKQGVEINFYARMHKKHAKDGRDWGLRCDECSRDWPPNRKEARA